MLTVVDTVVVFGGIERHEHAWETCEAPNAEQYGGRVGAARFSLCAAVGVKLLNTVAVLDAAVVTVTDIVLCTCQSELDSSRPHVKVFIHSGSCRGYGTSDMYRRSCGGGCLSRLISRFLASAQV